MIMEIDKKKMNNPIVLNNLEDAIDSAKGWLKIQKDILYNKACSEIFESYQNAINEIDKISSIKELNQICQSLINYKYIIWYEMVKRPVSIGCQPRGFVDTNNSKGEWGIVAYDRELTKKELDEYEMRIWNHPSD